MGVDVDEAGSDDEALGVDGRLAAQAVGRDDRDAAVADADLANAVQPAFRVDHPAAGDDDVIELRILREGGARKGSQAEAGAQNQRAFQLAVQSSLPLRCGDGRIQASFDFPRRYGKRQAKR
jgi:hypothetical protein